MMYLLLSITLLFSCTANAQNNSVEILSTSQQMSENDLTLDTEKALARVVVPIAKEIDLQHYAQIYKKLLHDLNALNDEKFADESLRETVRTMLLNHIAVTKKILDQEAPELAAHVEQEYAWPRKRLMIIGTLATVAVGAGILALFSYDSTTGTWGKPRFINAKTSLANMIDKFSHAFDDTPPTPTPPPAG